MRLFLTVFLSFVVLLLVAALIGPSFVDWNQYKSQGQSIVKDYTGYDLVLNGDVEMSFFPAPHLIVKDAHLKAPINSRVDDLASVQSLEIYVDPIALLDKRLEVYTLNIIEPKIAIETSAQGKGNWVTTEIELLQKGSSGSDGVKSENAGEQEKTNSSFDVAFNRVRIKNGSFVYYDGAKRSEQKLEEVNLDLSADSLSGPFAGDGSVALNGMPVSFEASVPYIKLEEKEMPLRLMVALQDMGTVSFNGAVDFGDKPAAQGEVKGALSGLNKLAGLANDSAAIEAFVSADATKADFKDVKVIIGESLLNGSLSVLLADSIQAQGRLTSKGDFAVAPVVFNMGAVDLSFSASMKDQTVAFRDTAIALAGQKVVLDGSYSLGSAPNLKLSVKADSLDLDKLMLKGDSVQSGSSGSSKTASSSVSSNSLKGVILPLNFEVGADVGSLSYQGNTYSGLVLDVVHKDGALVISKLSVADAMGAKVSVSGAVTDLATLSGMEFGVNLDASDVHQVMKKLGQDDSSVPAALKAVSAKVKAKGSVDQIAFAMNAKALDGELLAQGNAAKPLDDLALSDLVVQVKHPNLSNALKSFTGNAYPQLAKKLDFYTKLSNKGKVYSLIGMKTDLAGAPIEGDLVFDLSGSVPSLSGAVSVGDLSLVTADGAKAKARAASGGVAVTTARSGTDKWSSDTIDASFLHLANVDLKLSAKSISTDNWSVTSPSIQIVMKDGALDIKDMSGRLYGGTVFMNASVKAAAKDSPLVIAADTKLRDVDIEKVMTSFAEGSKLLQGSGNVSLDATIKSSGASQMALVKAFSGEGRVSGSDIVLEGFDVTKFVQALDIDSKPGDTLLGLWNGASAGGSTGFSTLEGAFTIENGIVKISSMDLDGDDASIATTGSVDLPKWWISTDHTITAKNYDDVPSFDVSIDGSLDDPQQTFAQGPLQNYLSSKLSRKLEKVIDDKLGDKLGGSVGRVLKGVLGGSGSSSSSSTQGANDNSKTNDSNSSNEAINGLLKGLLGR